MSQKSNGYIGSKKPRNLPYSVALRPNPEKTLVVLVGEGAWERAQSATWFQGCKVVMPSGQNPAGFNWTVARGFHDSIIWSFGEKPSDQITAGIAAQLLAYHDRVLLMHQGSLVACFAPIGVAA